MGDTSNLGKKAEAKIREWLDRPEEGYCFIRIPDQQSGFYGSKNPCDFILYRCPNFYMIESKATFEDRFEFNMLTDYQYSELLRYSEIYDVTCFVAVLFASHKRAFLINIRDIRYCKEKLNQKSLNIKKIDKWPIAYREIKTVPSRKELLDYLATSDNVL